MSPASRPGLGTALDRWFRMPPRIHGEVDRERRVSNLELFYDLVFVVLVGQLAHHLATHVSWHGLLEFVVMFSLVWNAWLNGSLYHELHSREDGRHRIYIFAQMYLLLVLAVLAGEATGERGPAFAITYAVLLLLISYQWSVVSRLDTVDRFRRMSRSYILMLLASAAVVLASAFVGSELRLWLWGAVAAGNVVVFLVQMFMIENGPEGYGTSVTDSLVERLDAFTIIVLGEVVVGTTNGIIEVGASLRAVVTGLLALTIGFGLWWNYFDLIGGRMPYDEPRRMSLWLNLHLPLHGTIAMSGAAMVSLIGHGEGHPSAATTWLLAGSTAMMLALLSVTALVIEYPDDVPFARAPMQLTLWAGVAVCVAAALLQPAAWLLAVILFSVLGCTWGTAFYLRATAGEGGHPIAGR